MIGSLLIANRGEIACRVIRTAKAMGIRTVAVFSDADADALHVRLADEAVHIGPSPARESYLVGERIIAAAKATGAEAVHPGYGFLSENADFAEDVIDAGLIWVGPHPASIRAMGLKDAAKALMAAAGVPVTPGYMGERQDAAFLAERAAEVGYPVLIKAVAGGGGKGMRLVERPDDFVEALASCQREAASSFANDHVLIEKYIQRPRHIEVQVFGDSRGDVVHLFERDCSLQRRHQKVIEEAPAPGMDAATREALCAAAVRAAKAVDYVGAGTIEFIADASEGLRADRIWFMEMNTRLQVEHPVTEEITGVDLVEWQLRVAAGEPLPLRQEQLSITGWAMEARLYAEDPAKGFLPSVGRLRHLTLPGVHADPFAPEGARVRVDTGVEQGAEVSPFYDPMIAKIIAHGPDRGAAIDGLAEALEQVAVAGVQTNAAMLLQSLAHPAFRAGDVDTGLIARDEAALTQRVTAPQRAHLAVAALGLVCNGAVLPPMADQWGWRLNGPPRRTVLLSVDGQPVEVEPDFDAPWRSVGGAMFGAGGGGTLVMTEAGTSFEVSLYRPRGSHGGAAGDGAIMSPMPGKVIGVEVAAGDIVTEGQRLLTLEAMKMEHTLTAPFAGTVAELTVAPGDQVQVEALLARIEPEA